MSNNQTEQNQQPIILHANVTTSTTPDSKGYLTERTAIVLEPRCSIDIVNSDGELICRIGGFYHGKDGDTGLHYATINVLLKDPKLQGQMLAYAPQQPPMRATLENATIYVVEIAPKQ